MQSYSWKRMECTSGLARFIEFSYSDKHAICLNSRIRELEGSVAQTIVCRGRRGNCLGLQHAGPSMLCNMLGERSRTSLHLVILRDLPHTYSCTCFYSKEKQWWKQTRTLPVLNTGESKLYWIKKAGSVLFFFIFCFLYIYIFCLKREIHLVLTKSFFIHCSPNF